jgi:hypothetical protein
MALAVEAHGDAPAGIGYRPSIEIPCLRGIKGADDL